VRGATRLRRLAFTLLLCVPLAAVAQDAQTILHLLDYIGVDYPEESLLGAAHAASPRAKRTANLFRNVPYPNTPSRRISLPSGCEPSRRLRHADAA
jgi:hypothetical protein